MAIIIVIIYTFADNNRRYEFKKTNYFSKTQGNSR